MAVTEDQQGTFIRPDGKEKVTGSGRYTADLNRLFIRLISPPQ